MRYANSDIPQLSSISHHRYRAAIILVFINDAGGGVWGVLYMSWNTGALNRRGLGDKLLQVWEQMTLSYKETKRNINIPW